MTDNFPYAAIKDVAEVKGGKRLPKGSELRSTPSPFPYIRVTDVREGTIDVQQLLFVPPEVQPHISRYTISSDDIFVSIVGTVGLVAKIPESISGANLTENAAKIVCDPQKVDNRFLRFFLQSDSGQAKIREQTVGSTQPKLALFRLGNIKFPFPDLNNQRRIADVLSVLDDKIELNRRMNETLEAMAQAIFRDWFVDFGPTHRKLRGATDPLTIMGGLMQDTVRAQALADLFPAALGDDGLPEGWTFGRLEDVLELAYGKALPKGERRDGPIPVYGSGGVGGFHDTALVSGPSVIVGRKGTVGSLYWEDDDFYPIDTVFYVKSKRPMTYCYQLLQTLGLETMNTDAAVPGLNRNNAYRLEVPQPHNSKLLGEFGEIADVLRSKTTANVRENRTLAAIRDLLLPKLMSGEIRLQNAEKPIEVRV